MNKKLGIFLTAATLAASCNSEGHGSVTKLEDTKTQIFDTIKSDTIKNEEDNKTVNYSEVVEKGNAYDSLIQKVNAPIVSGNLLKPEMTITIDDGCGAKYTEQILDTLAKYDVKVTFFIPGTRIKLHAEQRKRAIKEGHQVCCHSYDHHYFRSSEPALLKEQILDWEQAVKDYIGEEYLMKMKRAFPFFRFPGGCGDSKPEHLAVLKELGYLPFGRSDCTWKVGQELHNGEIELFHVKPDDFGRISSCIQQAKAQGLTPKPLTETVNPDDGYETPITGKNLRSERKKANEILKSQ